CADANDAAEIDNRDLPPHPTPAPRPPRGAPARNGRRRRSMNAARLRSTRRPQPVPTLRISPFDRGRNWAGVWFVRNIKVLKRQTTPKEPIECKSFFATLANPHQALGLSNRVARAEARALLYAAGEFDLPDAVDPLQAFAAESGLVD